jgi:hypothetical protein
MQFSFRARVFNTLSDFIASSIGFEKSKDENCYEKETSEIWIFGYRTMADVQMRDSQASIMFCASFDRS